MPLSTYTSTRPVSDNNKHKRLGKGSNILTIVRKLLSETENWFSAENKDSYHFPGVLPKSSLQQLHYVPDILALNQSCDDGHFIWKDIQLSKGQLNKDRLIKFEVNDKMEEVYYRSAPCLGVKYCGSKDCSHVVPIRDKRNCPKHSVPLLKTADCPVEFVYIHPKDTSDKRRWFGGLVRCQKTASNN